MTEIQKTNIAVVESFGRGVKMRLYVYKKVKDGSDHYNLIIAEDCADAKNWTKAKSLLELRDTPCWFSNFDGDQACFKRIYELAKSGVKQFGVSEDGTHAFYGSNKVVFAVSEHFTSPFKLYLDGFQTVNNMWIKDKNVKPEIGSLVVVPVAIDDGVYEYHIATFGKGLDGGVEVEIFTLWDEIGTILTIDEIEAYLPFDEFTGG